jgi:Tfp pilus assembly protein PilP
MIKHVILYKVLFVFFTSIAFADNDPFSRSFTEEITQSSSADTYSSSTSYDSENTVHPIIRYDLSRYIVKGTIFAEQGSIAVVGIPGFNDTILFLGDELGKDSYTITEIGIDTITLSNKNSIDSAESSGEENIGEVDVVVMQIDNPMVGTE